MNFFDIFSFYKLINILFLYLDIVSIVIFTQRRKYLDIKYKV